MTGGPPADASRFHSPRCPACLHRLVGLPADGTCPECGAAYDAASRFAWTVRAGGRPGRSLALHFWPLGLWMAVTAFGAAAERSWGGDRWEWFVFASPLWACPLILVNSTIWSYRTLSLRYRLRLEDGPGPPPMGFLRFLAPPLVGGAVLAISVAIWGAFGCGCFSLLVR